METKRLIKKIEKDNKIEELAEQIKAEEKKEKAKEIEQIEAGRGYFYKQEKPLKTVGELTAEIDYHEYIAPILEDIEKQREKNKEIIAKAKEEYNQKTKKPMLALKELRALDNKLIGAGRRSNQFTAERSYLFMGDRKAKPVSEIVKGVIKVATTERDREKEESKQ